jgi:beta-glucosidase
MKNPSNQPIPTPAFGQFPDGFLWGTATAAFQVEGAASEDGRGPSVWDTYTRRPGAIANDADADVTCDHYHRYRDDVNMMKELGVKAYRFSVSWSRVFPNGTGEENPMGLDFYNRLVDELLAAGIEPWMTLFHWDLPQALEDRFGGWESKDCAYAFADYAGFMAKHLGDRVAGIFTINEFVCFLDKGYGAHAESFAPGKRTTRKVLNQARHHAVYGHGLAVQAVRAASPKPLRVGLAENPIPCIPILETQEHIGAAREAFRELNGMFLTPICEGAYHPAYLEDQGSDAPCFTEEEMAVISSPLDFLGLNLYAGQYIRHDEEAPRGWTLVPTDDEYPRMHVDWLTFAPAVLYWSPRHAAELWNPRAIYITENGCPNPDQLDETNAIMDTGRVMFLQQYLINAHRCVTEGYPLMGYFLWSLMDNFEWSWGYTIRFGIYNTNYRTLERVPKLSAKYYKQVIMNNACGGQVVR